MAGLRVRVGSTADLGRLSRRLRVAGAGGLQRDLQSNFRRASTPVLAQTRAAVLGAEFTGTRGGVARPDTSTGLRGRLAAATTVTPNGAGVRFKVEGQQVHPRYGARLAKLSDTTLAPRWRHPVFNTGRWTTQQGTPWFFVTIRAASGQFAAAAKQAMQVTARKITG